MTPEEKTVHGCADSAQSLTMPTEGWMDFLADDLTAAERKKRERWAKQIGKLFQRCIVKTCQAPLVDVNGRLRATNVIGKAVCSSCRKGHSRWYRWFRGKFTRTYFVNGNYLLKRRIGFEGTEIVSVVGKITKPHQPIGLREFRFTSRGEMKDGSPVPRGVRGPDLVDWLERPEVNVESKANADRDVLADIDWAERQKKINKKTKAPIKKHAKRVRRMKF